MSTFYTIDSARASFKEYLWGTKSPTVLIAWTLKLFRVRIPMSSDDPNTESTLPFVVEQLPEDVASSMAPFETQFMALGFHDPVFHVIHDPGTRTTIYWATYRHESEKYFARIHVRIWQQAQKPNRGLFPMFFTEFTDGTFLISSAGKPDVDAPKTVYMNRMPRAQCEALWQKHLALTEERGRQRIIAPVRSPADLIAATERHHILVRDFHLARGFFHVRTTDEQAGVDRYTAALEQARAGGAQYPEILAELDKLQEPKPAWGGTIWLLGGSVLLFILIGASQWDWKFTLWLIPTLFLHEGGHWIAMRIFKYRDLRMFFIPGFGAAVMGRNWYVPGWKRALVSLAGPLPGIGLGFVLGIAGMVTKNHNLLQAALILVLINGLNLLPIFPLDGGRFMQAVLFCRNRWLDVGFRVAAVAALLGLSVFGRWSLYVGIAMAVSLPITFKLAKITDNLRKNPLPPPLPGEDRIPTATAQTIISEVKAVLPSKLSNKATAQHALNVFETLSARPPGALASIGLLGLYGTGVVVAVLAGLLFEIAQEGKFSDFVKTAARQPRHTVSCGSVQSWQGTEVGTNRVLHHTLVTTLNSASSAKATFTSLTQRLPQTSQLTLFGESLVLTVPCSDDRARERWFNELQSVSSNTFVTVSNRPVVFNLMFIAPTSTETTNIERVLGNYFRAPGAHLIPPWSPAAKGAKFQTYDHARWEWLQMQREVGSVWTNAEVKSLNKKMAAARQRGAVNESEDFASQSRKAVDELRATALDRLRKDPAYDPQLADLYGKLTALNYTNVTERTEVLRQVAVKMGQASSATDSISATDEFDLRGIAHHSGLFVEVNWLSMDDPSASLPQLIDWLCENKCVGIRYDFVENTFGSDNSED